MIFLMMRYLLVHANKKLNLDTYLRRIYMYLGYNTPVSTGKNPVNNECVFLREYLHTKYLYMGVSKNRGTPKWMVYNGKPY